MVAASNPDGIALAIEAGPYGILRLAEAVRHAVREKGFPPTTPETLFQAALSYLQTERTVQIAFVEIQASCSAIHYVDGLHQVSATVIIYR